MAGTYDYGLWSLVAFNIFFFGAFVVSFLKPRRRVEWRSMGVFSAFIIALFAEMYGFPLTIYLFSSYMGSRLGVDLVFGHIQGHLWGTLLGLPQWITLLICQLGSLMMLVGIGIMGIGWWQIHRAQDNLVTKGIYGYVRHPQYSGLYLIIIGMLIQWPTAATLAMAPVLFYTYYKLAKTEEREVGEKFGEEYTHYKRKVSAFFPRLGIKGIYDES